ncbi:MAG: hypothetical protein ABIQ16_11635 [Polyangiaceae bacterium]
MANGALGVASGAPTIYLYPNLDGLRKYACVNSLAVGYYDGVMAIWG